MELTKKQTLEAFLTIIIVVAASASFLMPAKAQTVSIELKAAWPKWMVMSLSEHPYEFFYAIVKNTGTEPVYAQVCFFVHDATGDPIAELYTDTLILPLHPPRSVKLGVTWTSQWVGDYTVVSYGYYSADSIEWWYTDSTMDFVFTIIP